jgi:predicted MFS family arabinose efflux permease
MISEIVSEERLMNAVALNASGMNLMRLMGPAAGGVLMGTMGAGWVYVLMAIMYGVSGFALFPVRNRPDVVLNQREEETALQAVRSGFADIGAACRYIWSDRTVFTILMVNFVIVLFSMPYQTILPGFAKDILGASKPELGLLMSITGIGSLAGSLVIASMSAENRGRILLGSSLFLGVAMVFFAVSSWFWVTAVIVLAIGVGQAGRMSLSNVLIQTYTNSDYRGRVMSVYMLEFSLVAFGTFMVGIMANALGAQIALAVTAVALMAFVLYAFAFTPRMRNLP